MARFCRMCGAPVCESEEAPTASVVPAAPVEYPSGATTAPIPSAQGCEACGAPAGPGSRLCQDCLTLFAPPPPALPAPAAPAAAGPAVTPIASGPVATPTADGADRGRGLAVAVVLVVLVCGALGGAGVYFGFLKEDDVPPASSAESAPPLDAAEPVPSDPAPSARARESEQAPQIAESAPQVAEPVAPVADGEAAPATEQSAEPLLDGSAAALLEEHYRLIDAGDYEGAWQLFHPAYRDGAGAKWVETKYDELPNIDLDSLAIEEQRVVDDDIVRVTVDMVAADTDGDGAGVCRHFVGWSRVERTSTGWLYRPGEVDGIKPGLAARPISDSDPRCQRVLG